MRRLLNSPIHLSVALAVITVIGIAAGTLVAYQSVRALGLNQGGRISLVKVCVLDTPAIDPVTCEVSCPLCTAVWGTACASRNEILFTPSGGIGNYACPLKGERYLGGGVFPRVGGWSLLKAIFLGGQLLQPGISR